MAKTKTDVINELKDAVANCKTFESMMEAISMYIITNYKLKKITVTTTISDTNIESD